MFQNIGHVVDIVAFFHRAMSVAASKCPSSFTYDVVLVALRESATEMSSEIDRVRNSTDDYLFKITCDGQDRAAIAKFRGLLARLLCANSNGMFKNGDSQRWGACEMRQLV